MRKSILVLTYAISPTRGSEYSAAWNYVNEMSKDHNLVVVYGTSGQNIGDINELEVWLESNKIENVTFIAVAPNQLTLKLNYLNEKNIFSYSFYFAFRNWHRQVFKKVGRMILSQKIDLIHNLNPSGFREPGYLWKLDIPYLWGPIGGAQNRPSQLFDSLSRINKYLFTLRNWINRYQFNTSLRLRKAVYSSDLLLCSTLDNKVLFEEKFKKSVLYVPENAITSSMLNDNISEAPLKTKSSECNIVWIGSIDNRKSLNFLIDSLALLDVKNWHLHVIGDGPVKVTMQTLATFHKIDHKITWHGQIPRVAVMTLLKLVDLHVITSLGEGTPTILWETMANKIPTISLNHCGMKDVICDKCGVKINIESVQQVKTDLAFVISDLIQNPEKVHNLSKGVIECSKSHTWTERRKLFNKYYDLAIENWNKRI